MSFSTVTIPAGVTIVPVDTRTISKILTLPTVSTNLGRFLHIKDFYGTSSNSTITISTTGTDLIDDVNTRYTFSNAWGSFSLLSDGIRSWRLLGLYDGVFSAIGTFLPTQLSGLNLWLDAADTSIFTFSSGSNISQARDKSGKNYTFTQGGTASRLTLTQNNGYNTIYINSDGGTNAWMLSSVPLPTNLTILQVITPLSYSGGGTWQFFWSWAYSTNGNYLAGFRSQNSGTNFEPYITWYGNNGNSLGVTYGTTYLSFVEFTNNGASVRQSINGNLTPTSGTLASYTLTPTTFILGGDGPSNPNVYSRFYISEMIMLSNVLTVSQRQQLEGYLAWKWGLQGSLPTAHPYKNSAP